MNARSPAPFRVIAPLKALTPQQRTEAAHELWKVRTDLLLVAQQVPSSFRPRVLDDVRTLVRVAGLLTPDDE